MISLRDGGLTVSLYVWVADEEDGKAVDEGRQLVITMYMFG